MPINNEPPRWLKGWRGGFDLAIFMTGKFQRGDVVTLVSGGYSMTVLGVGKPWKGDKQVEDENYTQVMWLNTKGEMQVRNLENILLRKAY